MAGALAARSLDARVLAGAITDMKTSRLRPAQRRAAGDGRISVTRNGGRSWSSVTPTGFEGAIFTTIAMDVSGRGVTASGGYLLVKRNWAGAWQAPVFDGPSPNAAINAVALQGLHAVAVGEEGMILSSEDGGATWRRVSLPR